MRNSRLLIPSLHGIQWLQFSGTYLQELLWMISVPLMPILILHIKRQTKCFFLRKNKFQYWQVSGKGFVKTVLHQHSHLLNLFILMWKTKNHLDISAFLPFLWSQVHRDCSGYLSGFPSSEFNLLPSGRMYYLPKVALTDIRSYFILSCLTILVLSSPLSDWL